MVEVAITEETHTIGLAPTTGAPRTKIEGSESVLRLSVEGWSENVSALSESVNAKSLTGRPRRAPRRSMIVVRRDSLAARISAPKRSANADVNIFACLVAWVV